MTCQEGRITQQSKHVTNATGAHRSMAGDSRVDHSCAGLEPVTLQLVGRRAEVRDVLSLLSYSYSEMLLGWRLSLY